MQRRYSLLILLLVILLNACSLQTEPDESSVLPGEAVPTAMPLVTGTQLPGSQPIVITFGGQEADRKTFAPLITKFNLATPDVQVQFVALDDVYASADTTLDPSADIRTIVAAADTAITYGITADAVQKGYLADLKPLMDADASFDRNDFYPAALAGATFNNSTYILPRTMNLPLLSYNETAWLARGVPLPTSDWTWNDVFAAAQRLAQVRGDAVEFYGLADRNGMTPLLAELERTNTRLVDATGQVRIDQPAVAAALGRVAALTAVPDTAVNFYWFYRAVDRALQNKSVLVTELQQAQVLTEQYLDCVRAGNETATCATQVDPAYEGWEKT